MLILIADDDAGQVRLIEKNLHRVGLHNSTQCFENGQDVLDFLFGRGRGLKRAPNTPLLLLPDIRMPKVDGVEVCKNQGG